MKYTKIKDDGKKKRQSFEGDLDIDLSAHNSGTGASFYGHVCLSAYGSDTKETLEDLMKGLKFASSEITKAMIEIDRELDKHDE